MEVQKEEAVVVYLGVLSRNPTRGISGRGGRLAWAGKPLGNVELVGVAELGVFNEEAASALAVMVSSRA